MILDLDMQLMLEFLLMSLNLKCMASDKNNHPFHISIYDKPIEQVSEFIYLNHEFSCKNDETAAVQHRVNGLWEE